MSTQWDMMKNSIHWLPLLAGTLITICTALPVSVHTQTYPIGLEEAMEIAGRHYLPLLRDQQHIEQQQAMIEGVVEQNPTHVFLAGQQLDLNGKGINGIGFSQDFNWPGTRKRRQATQRQRTLLGNAQLELTRLELEQTVAFAYFELLYSKDALRLSREQAELMAELVELANLRFELGETGKIPLLSAQGKEQQSILRLEQARYDNEIAHVIFNNWLYTDTLYTCTGTGLPPASGYLNWFVNGGHPELLHQQQLINVAESKVVSEKSWRIPRLSTGFQLQMIDDDSPFYAYQMGMKVPLAQRSIKARIESAEVETEKLKTEMEATRVSLENRRQELIVALRKEQETLDFLNNELLPLAEEQINASRKAYSQGAVEYLEYLQNLEQAYESRWQYLEALKRYHFLRLQLEFLSGQR
jgi:cobalt-zinc-cadmium resistance protein CzcA